MHKFSSSRSKAGRWLHAHRIFLLLFLIITRQWKGTSVHEQLRLDFLPFVRAADSQTTNLLPSLLLLLLLLSYCISSLLLTGFTRSTLSPSFCLSLSLEEVECLAHCPTLISINMTTHEGLGAAKVTSSFNRYLMLLCNNKSPLSLSLLFFFFLFFLFFPLPLWHLFLLLLRIPVRKVGPEGEATALRLGHPSKRNYTSCPLSSSHVLGVTVDEAVK